MRVSTVRRGIVETTTKANFTLSRLSNGLRILTSDDGTGSTGVGLFSLNATKFETEGTFGAAAVLEALPLRGNDLHSHEEISRSVGALGNAFKVQNNKEAMGTMIMSPRYHVPEALELLNGMCLHPTRDETTFREAKQMVRERGQLADRDAVKVCFELIHSAAWNGQGLGNDLSPTDEQLDQLTHDAFLAFHRRYTTPSRSVVAGTGVADHATFALLCEKSLSFPLADPADAEVRERELRKTSVPYSGGCRMKHNTKAPDSTKKFAEKNLTHVGLMYQGVPINHPDYYSVALLQSLLGGGTSFSSGGPGKGMQTKLFREVINREGWIHGIECISAWYSDGGIIGLYGSSPHEWRRHLLYIMLHQAASICQRIDASDVEMAKNQLMSQLILLGEQRELLLTDMGFNMVVHNYVTTVDEIMSGTASVTLGDLSRVCRSMIEKPITFALYGDTTGIPSHNELESQLRKLYHKMNAETLPTA